MTTFSLAICDFISLKLIDNHYYKCSFLSLKQIEVGEVLQQEETHTELNR